MSYEPTPIQTSDPQWSPDIEQLIERLAKNTHEVWAQRRFAEGWTHGPRRDDQKKHHPCLVAYEQLPESEKEYDRHTAREALRVIIALGYRIEKGPKSERE